ncbi:MAG TPA: RIP metalloprotease RseP [Candidatus Eremiobacteraceae bacterium]|nr:RIP metalloprotease RseP [Candidatus Eremiobacteraceae bacterium]
MDILIGLIVLGIIILVHEWGHFIVARRFGVRVDVFSIGFGPRLFGIKRGDTDWRFSALPLGGYVRMAGQDITDVDSGDQKPTGAPDELLSKPRWQRALISFAGPMVNLLFPLVLLGGYYLAVGVPNDNALSRPVVVAGLPSSQADMLSGLKVGDKILSINGVKNPTWEQAQAISMQEPPGSTLKLQVANDGNKREVHVPASNNPYARTFGYSPIPPVIGEVALGTPADRAGLKPGDLVTAVDGRKIEFWDQFVDLVRNSGGKTLQLQVERKGQQVPVSVTPQKGITDGAENYYQIGIQREFALAYQHVGPIQALKASGLQTASLVTQTVDIVGKLLSGRVSVKQLQSVVGISRTAGQAVSQGSYAIIGFMALISVNLGILNLLPIPILDGGHIVLLAVEGIRRRDFSMAFKERIIQVGLVFLLVLIVYVTYNDVARMLIHHS